jgi:hypothetical protein
MTTKISSDNIQASTLSLLEGGGGVTVYATIDLLPLSNNSAGEMAYVTSNNRLYIWNGTGWFNIALINTNPTITQGPNPSYVFAIDGTPIVITLLASDPEGIPITWSYQVTSGTLGSTATISQNGNVFTITPSTDNADAGVFGVTFTASDGVNIATASSSFTLTFAAADQFYNQSVVLTTSSVNNGNNNVFVDSSNNNFAITRGSATTQGTFSPYSPAGWSAYFDGSGDFLSVTGSPGTTLTADFTIESWVYLNSLSVTQPILCIGDSFSNPGILFYIANDAKLSVAYANARTLTGSGSVTTSSWNHVAFVRSGSTITAYLNGISQGTVSNSATFSGTTTVIGREVYNNAVGSQFSGYISNLRIINGTALYTENFTPPTEPLTAVSGTSLLTLQDNRFIDRSTNNFTISRVGDVLVTPFSPFNPTVQYSPSVHGGSVFLPRTGTTGLLNAGTNSAFAVGTGDYTIESWVYIFTSGDLVIFVNDATGGLSFGINTSHNLYVGRRGVALDASTPLAESIRYRQWMHVAVSRSGTTLRFFVNGQLVSTQSNATNHTIEGPACVGGFATISGAGLNGYMSGFRFVKGTALYTSNFTPPTAPLTAVANTSLLLNFTNSNIFDETGKVVFETVGDARVSTSVVKYGDGSMAFDGTGDWIVQPTNEHYGYGTGDFTIEFWLNLNTVSTQTIVSNLTSISSVNPHFYLMSDATIRYYTANADRITGAALNTGMWYHIALCRASGSTRLFINGIQSGSTYSDTNDYGQTAPLGIGTYWSSGAPITINTLNGHISDLRITKGRARYTANFSPPTQKLGYNNAE